MRIGELAERAGCDVQTVRFYEREGLLEEPARDESGYRRYDERHAAKLALVRHCRSLDLPLPEVRQLLDFAAQPTQSCAQGRTPVLAMRMADNGPCQPTCHCSYLSTETRVIVQGRGDRGFRHSADPGTVTMVKPFFSAPEDQIVYIIYIVMHFCRRQQSLHRVV